MKHTLIVDSVSVRFGDNQVLSGGYVTACTGSVTGVLGRNGAGKSCMFRAAMGVLKAEYVSVQLDGKQLAGKQDIGKYVKYLPQGRMIPQDLTIKQAFDLFGVNYWEFVMEFPYYTRYSNSHLWEMSGGEARVAETYLVLFSDALFYILDEPFSQVSPLHVQKIKNLIHTRSAGHGIIITDHNYESVGEVCDTLFVVADGCTAPVKSREDLVRYGYLRR